MANSKEEDAIKVPSGITNRFTISDTIMQGTVWGSLMCTSSMDGMAKESYDQPQHMYIYKGVLIPPLEMVDVVLTVTKTRNTEVVNNGVNNFIKHKRLRLSKTKCHRIHIGKGHNNCPPLKVHGEDMLES